MGQGARDIPYFFDADYREVATLRDGTTCELRLVMPDDRALLRAGFMRLSEESRYARFLGPKTSLSEDELTYLTDVDQMNHFALGATRDGAGLGIARFIRLPDEPTIAEAAVAVADEAHGRGLGKLLFLRLCAAAAERKVERFRCEVLGSNNKMKELVAAITPDRTVHAGGGIMSIELAIPGVEPSAPPASDPGPLGPMYSLFRAAAENAVEWTDAVRRLWRR
jgi:GNAT superfamily N-acetyltransferase